MQQFKEKDSSSWKWVLWGGISSFIVVVGWSIYHMTPGLLPVALAMCSAGVAVSFVYTVYTTVNAWSLRRRAWLSEALIVLGLAVNVVIHAGLSRRFDVATQAREARHVEEEREQQRLDAEAKRKQALQASEAALLAQQSDTLEKQRRLTESQNRQLGLVFRENRRLPVGTLGQGAPSGSQGDSTEPTPSPVFSAKAKASAVVMLSPEEVQEQSWWWVLMGILAEVGCIVGTFIYFVRGYIGDGNKNGVADWKEELDPLELAERYPEDYQRLYGGRAGRGSVPYSQQSPGFVQPLAQSNPEQQRKNR